MGVLYPTSETQHIRGPQNSYTSAGIPFQARSILSQHTSTTSTSNSLDILSNASTNSPAFIPTRHPCSAESDDQDVTGDVLQHQRNHPAISRLSQIDLDTYTSQRCQEPWVAKWRPMQAEQVLGNEQNAIYLRQWLQALALHIQDAPSTTGSMANGTTTTKTGNGNGMKRPRVKRAVQKHRGRKRLRRQSIEDDWIVDDDFNYSSGDEERMFDINPDEGSCFEHAGLLANTIVQSGLTNTILLVGPPGCGKTAAVYACAEELGWEVFEVYPGIGKRSSTTLDHLIGDVGKNHLVRNGQNNHGSQFPFTRPQSSISPTGMDLPIGKEALDQDPSFQTSSVIVCESATRVPHNAPTRPEIRQSVVLLEEVDILFKEDVGFWPAVVNLIKDCKRPLIMTCSDITLIPTDDLPLQTILTFIPCPTHLAVSYLESLCMAEGCIANRRDLHRLYLSGCDSGHVEDATTAPADLSYTTSPKPDLRRAINHLQFWCSHSKTFHGQLHSTGHEDRDHLNAEMLNWNNLVAKKERLFHPEAVQHIELASSLAGGMFGKCHSEGIEVGKPFWEYGISYRPASQAQALSMRSTDGQSMDDEIGHTIFCAATPHPVGHHCKERMMTDDIMRLSRGAVERMAGEDHAFTPPTTFTRRAAVESRSQILDALNALIPSSAPHLPLTPTVLDYEPWVRHMVALDDMHERNRDEVRTRRLRRVTRSGQGSYERYLSLSTEQLDMLRATRFGDLE